MTGLPAPAQSHPLCNNLQQVKMLTRCSDFALFKTELKIAAYCHIKCIQRPNVCDSRGCKLPGFTLFALRSLRIPNAFDLPSFLNFSPRAFHYPPCPRLMQMWFEFITFKSTKLAWPSTETHLGSAHSSAPGLLFKCGRCLSFYLKPSLYQCCWLCLQALQDRSHLLLGFSITRGHNPWQEIWPIPVLHKIKFPGQ